MDQKKLLRKTFFWTALSGLLYASVSFLLPMITTGLLDNAHGGLISSAILVSSQLLSIGLFSVRTFQLSDHHKEFAFGNYMTLRILTVLLMLAIGACWVWVGGYTAKKAGIVFLLVLYKAIEAFSDVFEGEFQQQGRFYMAGRIVAMQNTVNLLVYFTVLWLTKSMLYAAAAMDAVFAVLVVTVNVLVLEKPRREYRFWPNKETYRLFCTCFPAFLNAFLLMYLDNCSKFAVEATSQSEVYYEFSTLFMCVFVINLFASFCLKTFLKQCSDDYYEHRIQALVKIMLRQTGFIGILTVVCIAGAQLVGLHLLGLLYHCDLMGYRSELTVLLVAGGINAMNSMLLNVLVIMRKQKKCFALTCICAAAAFVVMPMCVCGDRPFLGAGFGFLGVVTLLFFLYFAAAVRELRLAAKTSVKK